MKVLLATDGTKFSQAAVKVISLINLSPQSEIKIISVIDMTILLSIDTYADYLPPTVELENTSREHADKLLSEAQQDIVRKFGGLDVNVTMEVLSGSPESRIVETAEEIKADLIIIGSHGYNRGERLWLGSVSDSAVHHAPALF